VKVATVPSARAGSRPTLVLVHGAGHTSLVWERVQDHLDHASLAIDLPGRRDRPADITRLTIDAAASSAARDVADVTDGALVLVGHSAGGIVLPSLAARLDGRVEQLVFVAGLSARHGEAVVDTVRPDARMAMAARLDEMREQYAGHMLGTDLADRSSPAIDDVMVAMGIESLNLMGQPVSWKGVAPSVRRTFVRCLGDRIQPLRLQAQLIANCDASNVVDLDSGHTPAIDAPESLAAALDGIATS
jgi:pimeloyl-ACP methyl ester carboxylesterase